MLSFDGQLCLLPGRRWRRDRNNSADILCDPWRPAQRGKCSLLKRVMCPGSLLSCNGMERIKRAKWECLQRQWLGDFVSLRSIRHCCCDVSSDYYDLPVTHTWRDLGVLRGIAAFDGFVLCFSAFTFQSTNDKIADNCFLFCLSLYMVAPLFEAAFFYVYNVMWMCPTENPRGALSGRKNLNNHHFSRGRGDFSNAASISMSSIMLMNAKMASWWAFSAGVPSESCRKHCVPQMF